MNSRASPILLLLFFICLVLVQIPLSLSNVDANKSCSSQFNCGNMTGVGYPLWGGNRSRGCGCPGLELNCDSGVATIEIMQLKYRVLDIYLTAQLLQIARQDDMNGCLTQLVSTTLNSTLFDYAPGYGNLTFSYGCPPTASNYNSSCQITEYSYKGVHVGVQPAGPEKCNTSVTVPVLVAGVVEESMTSSVADQLLRQGFEVKWEVDGKACRNCTRSSPPAGAPWASPPPPAVGLRWNIHSGSSNLSLPLKISIGVAAGVGSIVVIFIMICSFRRRRECLCYKQMVLWKKEANNEQNVDVCIRNHGFLAPKRYSYSNVKKMTNSFTDKLGQGGYGSVYKGKLTDGRLVAVKVLSESKGNGEEFINEVASISRISHINIVTLLGFCYERTKRALIYELMPNGSLDKFIYDRRSSNANSQLEWNMLYKIVVGIARGLEYLHRGCTTRILHFDIKPQNILLDEDFCPKISDFGLAKLCQKKESVVSMVGARGTAGYIAPEVFCRTFGAVSHKSDVYSYGMMVLEMVGGRKNVDVGVVRTSEINFPHWIYDHLELGEDLNLHGVMTTEEEETARKMILVSLWCIQTNPSNRPSISKVVEMLEGSLQSIQIPPQPFLFSPTRSP